MGKIPVGGVQHRMAEPTPQGSAHWRWGTVWTIWEESQCIDLRHRKWHCDSNGDLIKGWDHTLCNLSLISQRLGGLFFAIWVPAISNHQPYTIWDLEHLLWGAFLTPCLLLDFWDWVDRCWVWLVLSEVFSRYAWRRGVWVCPFSLSFVFIPVCHVCSFACFRPANGSTWGRPGWSRLPFATVANGAPRSQRVGLPVF